MDLYRSVRIERVRVNRRKYEMTTERLYPQSATVVIYETFMDIDLDVGLEEFLDITDRHQHDGFHSNHEGDLWTRLADSNPSVWLFCNME